MITKSYSIMCMKCTKAEGLLSQNQKECEQEAKKWVGQNIKKNGIVKTVNWKLMLKYNLEGV